MATYGRTWTLVFGQFWMSLRKYNLRENFNPKLDWGSVDSLPKKQSVDLGKLIVASRDSPSWLKMLWGHTSHNYFMEEMLMHT